MPNVKVNDLHFSDLSKLIYIVYIDNEDRPYYEILKDTVVNRLGLYNEKEFALLIDYRQKLEEINNEKSSF